MLTRRSVPRNNVFRCVTRVAQFFHADKLIKIMGLSEEFLESMRQVTRLLSYDDIELQNALYDVWIAAENMLSNSTGMIR